MVGLVERLEIIEQEQLETLSFLENEYGSDKRYDENGSISRCKKGMKRLFALCDYKLRGDIEGFRKNLRDSAALTKSFFDRYNEGDPIPESFVTMNSFYELLDALASGDFELSKSFAQVMGGRESIEIENDHPFDRAFGYALRALILDYRTDLDHWLKLANSEVKRSDVKYFQGYVDGLYAIRDKDNEKFQEAMNKILKDHKKLCQPGGIYDDTKEEALCFGGLGLINLARDKGLDVTVDDEYLPEELIV